MHVNTHLISPLNFENNYLNLITKLNYQNKTDAIILQYPLNEEIYKDANTNLNIKEYWYYL